MAINDYLSGVTGGYLLDPAKASFEKRYGVNGIKLYADMPTQSATGIGEAIQYGIDPFSGMVVEMPQTQVARPQAAPVVVAPTPQPAPYVPIDWSKRIPTMRNVEAAVSPVSNALAREGIGTLTGYARPEGARMTGGVSPVTGEQLPAPPIVGGIGGGLYDTTTGQRYTTSQIGGGGFTVMPVADVAALSKAQALTDLGLKEGTPEYDKRSDEYDRLMAASPAPTSNPVLDELNRQKAEYDRYSWPEMLRKGQAAGIPMANIIAKYNELQKVRPPALTAEQEKIRYEAMGMPTAKAESAAKTVAVGDKIMQWNPKTGKYDVEVGAAPIKTTADAAMKPPPSRKVLQGNQVVTQEWNPDTRKWTDIATGSQKGYAEGGKILPAKTVDSIDTLRQSIQRLGSLKDAFKGEYGGHTLAGGWSTKFSELVGSDTGYTNWWKDYKELDAVKRHELFGSQLTAGEKKSWDAITVNERSAPKTIQAAIANRLRLTEEIFNRKRDTLQKAGYDISGFEAEDVTPSAGFPRAIQPADVTAPTDSAISAQTPAGSTAAKTITRTGMYQGRKIIQYSDGSKEYAP